jgi:hypothetical protein
MSFELRPSNNEAFHERLRSAEARKLEDINNTIRRPRVADISRAKCRRDIEVRREMLDIERQNREIWE